jgi:hypothetical protein
LGIRASGNGATITAISLVPPTLWRTDRAGLLTLLRQDAVTTKLHLDILGTPTASSGLAALVNTSQQASSA